MITISNDWYAYHDGSMSFINNVIRYLNEHTSDGSPKYTGTKSGVYYGVINGEPFRRKRPDFFAEKGMIRYETDEFATYYKELDDMNKQSHGGYSPNEDLSNGGWFIIADGSIKSRNVIEYLSSRNGKLSSFKGTIGTAYGLDDNKLGRCRKIKMFKQDNQKQISISLAYSHIPDKFKNSNDQEDILKRVFNEFEYTLKDATHRHVDVNKLVSQYEQVTDNKVFIGDLAPDNKVTEAHILYDIRYRDMSLNDITRTLSNMSNYEFNKLSSKSRDYGNGGIPSVLSYLKYDVWGVTQKVPEQKNKKEIQSVGDYNDVSLSRPKKKAKRGGALLPQEAIVIKRRRK